MDETEKNKNNINYETLKMSHILLHSNTIEI